MQIATILISLFAFGIDGPKWFALAVSCLLFIIGVRNTVLIQNLEDEEEKFWGSIFWGGIAFGGVILLSPTETYLKYIYLPFIASVCLLFIRSISSSNMRCGQTTLHH